jgi:hypothetical protein
MKCQRGKCQQEAVEWGYYTNLAPLLVCVRHGKLSQYTLPIGLMRDQKGPPL